MAKNVAFLLAIYIYTVSSTYIKGKHGDTELAQGCKTYDEFIGKKANTLEVKLNYIGIAICGNKKQENKFLRAQ